MRDLGAKSNITSSLSKQISAFEETLDETVSWVRCVGGIVLPCVVFYVNFRLFTTVNGNINIPDMCVTPAGHVRRPEGLFLMKILAAGSWHFKYEHLCVSEWLLRKVLLRYPGVLL